jgi:hypothetical protein
MINLINTFKTHLSKGQASKLGVQLLIPIQLVLKSINHKALNPKRMTMQID